MSGVGSSGFLLGVAEQALQTISLTRLALVSIPALAVLVVLSRWRIGTGDTIHALARMLGQLLLVGYFLIHLFESESAWPISAVLCVMMLASSWIALRTVPKRRRSLFLKSLAAVTLGGGGTLAWIAFGVLELDPWYTPRFLVPIAGMVYSSSLNSVSLAAERVFSELERGTPKKEARSIALKAALVPITNSLFAVGLVSLPGMMTGQILSGVSPLIAARYQIMVMGMIFGAAGLSASLFLRLALGRVASEGVPVDLPLPSRNESPFG